MAVDRLTDSYLPWDKFGVVDTLIMREARSLAGRMTEQTDAGNTVG